MHYGNKITHSFYITHFNSIYLCIQISYTLTVSLLYSLTIKKKNKNYNSY